MKHYLWFYALAAWTRITPRMAAPSHYDASTPLSALHYHIAGWLATITLFLAMASATRKPRWRSLVKALRPGRCEECGHPQYRALSTERHPLCTAIFAQRWKAIAIRRMKNDEMMKRAVRFAVESGGLTNAVREHAPKDLAAIANFTRIPPVFPPHKSYIHTTQ